MKLVQYCVAMLAMTPLTAIAQTAPAPAPAPAPTASIATSGAINGDTPIETIMANPAGKAAIEKSFPEIPGHPAYEQFKAMSLRQLQPLAGGIITDEKIAAFEAATKPK